MTKIRNRREYPYEDYHKEINNILHKKCAYHNEFFGEEKWFPCTKEYFYKNKMNKLDGLYPECIECSKKKASNWQKSNPERYKEILKNTDKNENRAVVKSEWSRKSRESGERKIWEQNNPDKMQGYWENGRKQKVHTLTKQQWINCKDYFKNEEGEWCCAYCGLPINQHFGVYRGIRKIHDFQKDHVDDEGSNGIENCVPSCKECNSSKGNKGFDIWYNPINNKRRGGKIYTEERHNKIIKWLTEDHKKYM